MDESLDYKALAFWWSIFQFLYTLLISVWMYNANKHRATTQTLETRSQHWNERHSRQESRLIRLESEMENLPDQEDVSVIHARISDTAQCLTALQGELKQINSTMQMMHKHLLSKSNTN